jgi:hypothetical protein
MIPAPPRASRREWVGLAVLALACLLCVMDPAESEASRERPASPARQTLEAADY